MFQRFHEKRDERGFTLIELLVVILIIAILAAIAIPVFLNQRKKGWVSQTESALKNAATAQESFLTGSPTGAYATTVTALEGEGFKKAPDVTFVDTGIKTSGGTWYCLQMTHKNLGTDVYSYDSSKGRPIKEACGTAPA